MRFWVLTDLIAATYSRSCLLHFGVRPDNLVDPPCVLGIPNHVVAEKTS